MLLMKAVFTLDRNSDCKLVFDRVLCVYMMFDGVYKISRQSPDNHLHTIYDYVDSFDYNLYYCLPQSYDD